MLKKSFRFYNTKYDSPEWHHLKELHLDKQPFCTECQSTFDLQVDHIFEHKNDPELFWDENNLQTLCLRCHAHKSSLENIFTHSKQGYYLINLKNNNDIFLKIKSYESFFNNRKETIKRVLEEVPQNSNLSIGIQDLSLNDICYLIFALIWFYKAKPDKIKLDRNLNKNTLNTLSKWLHFKNLKFEIT